MRLFPVSGDLLLTPNLAFLTLRQSISWRSAFAMWPGYLGLEQVGSEEAVAAAVSAPLG